MSEVSNVYNTRIESVTVCRVFITKSSRNVEVQEGQGRRTSKTLVNEILREVCGHKEYGVTHKA
jgi:hypothetical protein